MILQLKLLFIALSAICQTSVAKSVDRSYQLASIPVINGVQSVQYVPMTALYSEVPVLVQKPVGMDVMALQSTPASTVVIPQQGLLQQKYYESSTPLYPTGNEYHSVQEPVLQPMRTVYGLRKAKHPAYAVKRPSYYNFNRKKITGVQNQKVSSLSIEPSIDISDHLQFASTTPVPASTYGPAKVLDHKLTHVTTYIRPKVHHPHPHYHPKDYRVYSHMHKGHIHNHHIPPTYSMHKSQYYSSAKPIYPTVLKPTVASYLDVPYSSRTSFTTNHVRFPDGELKKSLLNAYKAHQEEILTNTRYASKPHSEVTQALVKEGGIINNFDASIPVKIPTKKPNKFEVKEILRNADVHFIDGTLHDPEANVQYHPQLVQFAHRIPYQTSQVFDPTKFGYQQIDHYSNDGASVYNHGISTNQIDYYDQRDAASVSQPVVQTSNQDELSTSESVKLPVAVIKGGHPVSVTRTETEKSKQKFTPSSTSSDWIPMSGKLLPASAFPADPAPAATKKTSDRYYGDVLGTRSESAEPTRIITATSRTVGDIISGKIPGQYSPFQQTGIRSLDTGSDIITGSYPYGKEETEMDRRKGSVIDDNPNSGDTSNLVVSSMIKFS